LYASAELSGQFVYQGHWVKVKVTGAMKGCSKALQSDVGDSSRCIRTGT